ncbi:MAG: phosphate ABC transporter permease subunit PstC, partial [Acidithiobacillus ferrivorans]
MDDTRDAELGMREAAVPSSVVPSRIGPARSRRLHAMDRGFRWLTGGLAFLVLLLLVGVALSLFLRGWEAFHHFGFAFFWSEAWDPVTENFGALVPIYGTLVSSLIAMLIAVPISFGIALFISELALEWL